jgi:hypothetical protein
MNDFGWMHYDDDIEQRLAYQRGFSLNIFRTNR